MTILPAFGQMKPLKLVETLRRVEWQRPPIIALVLANLVPLAGVFVFRWEVFPLLFLFWLENVAIGVLNALKMLLASSGDLSQMTNNPALRQKLLNAPPEQLKVLTNPAVQWVLKLALIPFFCFHYGMFTAVHGVFIVALFGGASHHVPGFLNVNMAFQIIRDNHLEWALAGLVTSHLISFGYNYLWRGEFRRTNVMVQMMQPYSRVVMLHLTIIAGGFVMMALHSPAVGLAILVCLKIIFDLRGHQAEREKFATQQTGG